MASNVLAFASRVANQPGWTNAELAELYRVENALIHARIPVETDHGVTDEGDPWFVFCRPGGEVIIHAARFGGLYRLFSPALPDPLAGPSFSALTQSFVAGLRTPVQANASVSIHPSALLTVLIAAIFSSFEFHSGNAEAAEIGAANTEATSSIDASSKAAWFQSVTASISAFLDPLKTAASQLASFAALESVAVLAYAAFVASGLADQGGQTEASGVGASTADPRLVDGSLISAADERVFDDNDRWSEANNTSRLSINQDVRPEEEQVQQHSKQNAAVVDGSAALRDHLRTDYALAALTTETPLGAYKSGDDKILNSQDEQAVVVLLEGRANDGDGSVLNEGNSSRIAIALANGAGTIDLGGMSNIQQIAIVGDGNLHIIGIGASGTPQLVFAAGLTASLSLSFAETSSGFVTITLGGQNELSLSGLSFDNAIVHLTLDSEGSAPNVFTIADPAIASGAMLDLRMVGIQDLTLFESAAAFSKTMFDTSELAGALTIGLDVSSAFQSVDLSHVRAANFVVASSGNVALLNVASGSHVQLSNDINIVDITLDNTTIAGSGMLSLNLQSQRLDSGPIEIETLDVFYTPNLALHSADAGLGGVNTIRSLIDSSLSMLTITGDSDLTIGTITGPTAGDVQSITIDAHALTGALSLDLSAIADVAASGRLLTVIGGIGDSVLINMTSSASTTFVAGAGQTVITMGTGSTLNTVANLKTADMVIVGSNSHADVLVDARTITGAQSAIDDQSNVVNAAVIASQWADSEAAHQAVLLSYRGGLYVFIDATGNQQFDVAQDGIMRLVGIGADVNLAGVFHSA
jgi:hypothetical protein